MVARPSAKRNPASLVSPSQHTAETIVGCLQGKLAAERMVGETRHCHVVAGKAETMGELVWGVGCAIESYDARQATHLAVEQVGNVLVEHGERSGGSRHIFHLPTEHVIVDAAVVNVGSLVLVIGVEGQRSRSLQQVEQGRRHAPQRNVRASFRQEIASRLFLQQASRHIIGGERYGVAHHQAVGFDGGQHGIGPAEVAVPLVANGRGLEHHLVGKLVWGRLGRLGRRSAAGCHQADDEQPGPHFLHIAAKLLRKEKNHAG